MPESSTDRVVETLRNDILTGRYACYDLYPAADGRWLSVAAIEPRFFANLCRALDCEDHIAHQADDDRQEAIRSDFRAAFATRDRDDWVAELGPADCCVAAVATVPEVAEDSRSIIDAVHPTQGTFRQVGPVLAGQGPAADVPDWARTHTDEVLAAVGYNPDQLDAMRDAGVIA